MGDGWGNVVGSDSDTTRRDRRVTVPIRFLESPDLSVPHEISSL